MAVTFRRVLPVSASASYRSIAKSPFAEKNITRLPSGLIAGLTLYGPPCFFGENEQPPFFVRWSGRVEDRLLGFKNGLLTLFGKCSIRLMKNRAYSACRSSSRAGAKHFANHLVPVLACHKSPKCLAPAVREISRIVQVFDGRKYQEWLCQLWPPLRVIACNLSAVSLR